MVQKTSDLTYTVKKKGGRIRRAHVNRLKFYDPKNSHEDPTVHISVEDDEQDNHDTKTNSNQPTKQEDTRTDTNQNQRITRSKTHSLPPSISRYSSTVSYIPL